MKYKVSCPNCGTEYVVKMNFEPGFCIKCGSDLVNVSPVKTKSRERAEKAMGRLVELGPTLEAAREAWVELLVAYEDELQILRQYKKRGIVSAEELENFSLKNFYKKNTSELLKEYRRKKNTDFDSYLRNELAKDEELEKEYDALDMVGKHEPILK